MFVSAALPHTVFPPLFNRYEGGQAFAAHVDNAIRVHPSGLRIRSDLSATLFLSEPSAYDGGELTIETAYGPQTVKLPAGDMVLYPSRSLHHVTPVTRGARVSSFFWIQCLIADDQDRETLFQLDVATQRVAVDKGPTRSGRARTDRRLSQPAQALVRGLTILVSVHPSEGWGPDHGCRRPGSRTGLADQPAESSIWTPAFAGVHG